VIKEGVLAAVLITVENGPVAQELIVKPHIFWHAGTQVVSVEERVQLGPGEVRQLYFDFWTRFIPPIDPPPQVFFGGLHVGFYTSSWGCLQWTEEIDFKIVRFYCIPDP
jgi:hypothetical protein